MFFQDELRARFGKQLSFEEVRRNTYRIYAPFFHEDGDMYSIYISNENDKLVMHDFGNTLMRVSYTFDLDSPNKQKILDGIVHSNDAELSDGILQIATTPDNIVNDFFRYTQLVSKVSCIDLLQREVIKSMFYEYLGGFIDTELSGFNVSSKVKPTNEDDLVVDYVISAEKPIFLFGVNDNAKASKVVITCLNFQKQNLHFKSLIVNEDLHSLSPFNQRQITNAADKQFFKFEDFKTNGLQYIQREIA